MKKNFTPLIICLVHTLFVVIILVLLNRQIVPYLKALENYSSLKGYITWINDLLGISLLVNFIYFILDFAKKNSLFTIKKNSEDLEEPKKEELE